MRKFYRNFITFFFVAASLTSCLTAKKFDRYVAQQYPVSKNEQSTRANNLVVINSTLLSKESGAISSSINKTEGLLPLLLYWQWKYRIICTINPNIPINRIKATASSNATRILKQKLNGQTLELTVEKIPHTFSLDSKGHSIFLLIYSINWSNVYIYSGSNEFVVSYKLKKDNVETKKGVVTIPIVEEKERLRMFKSWKTATTEYLLDYDLKVIDLTKQMLEKIAKEI